MPNTRFRRDAPPPPTRFALAMNTLALLTMPILFIAVYAIGSGLFVVTTAGIFVYSAVMRYQWWTGHAGSRGQY